MSLFAAILFGVVEIDRGRLPAMRKRRSGRIVEIGSVAGFVPIPF